MRVTSKEEGSVVWDALQVSSEEEEEIQVSCELPPV